MSFGFAFRRLSSKLTISSDLNRHQDSMGNTEKLTRGEIQMTSAGTGIRHGESNGGKGNEVSCRAPRRILGSADHSCTSRQHLHFLQIWAKPHTRGLKPSYFTR